MKKLNLSFCENLVDSDFFLVNQNINNNSQNVGKVMELGNKNLISLDILNLYKELRQLVRFIIFFKLKEKKRSKLILGIKDIQITYLLTTYLKNYFINFNLFVSKIDKIEKINKDKHLGVGLISFFSFSHKLEKHLNFNKVILLSMFKLNAQIRKESSVYKIYNKLDNYKKIFFFIALLENIFKIEH